MEENNKPEKLELEEPEETVLDQIIELYDRAASEFKTTKEREYWQGRKDGLRAALALLEPGETIWTQLNNSSHGFRVEEKEALLKFLEDARYNIGAALWEYKQGRDRKIDYRTLMNLLSWIGSYDMRAKKGDLLPAKNSIDPYDLYARRKNV